jgi:hypothetical protein
VAINAFARECERLLWGLLTNRKVGDIRRREHMVRATVFRTAQQVRIDRMCGIAAVRVGPVVHRFVVLVSGLGQSFIPDFILKLIAKKLSGRPLLMMVLA